MIRDLDHGKQHNVHVPIYCICVALYLFYTKLGVYNWLTKYCTFNVEKLWTKHV